MSDADGRDPLLGQPRLDMLPPLDRELVGRSDELRELRRLLRKGRAERKRRPLRLSITGVAGVGKSALGTSFADSLRGEYRDGTLYVDLNRSVPGDAVGSSQILRGLLQALGESPDRLAPDADLRSKFIEATDEKNLILFLDNVQNYERVKDLVPNSPTCLVIFTSLGRLDETIHTLPLQPLSVEFAVELFGTVAPSRKVDDAQATGRLVKVLQACAGLPIAILPLAARLEDNPGYTLDRMLEDLEDMSSLFGDGRQEIEVCFRVSYGALTEVQSMLFRRLSVLPGESFDVSMAACLSELTPGRARQVVEKLRALQLIQGTQDKDYFTMHSLLRQFAREQLDETEEEEQLKRALFFLCEQAEDADRVIRSLKPQNNPEWPRNRGERVSRRRDPAEERDRALRWMEEQHKNLVAAVIRACNERQADIAWRTCRALVEFFDIRGKWESWKQTHEAAEKVVPKHSEGAAHVSYGLGRYHGSRQQWKKAIAPYRTAIAVFRQHNEQVQVGRSLNSLGDAYRYMRDWNAAENCFKRSLEILETVDYPRQLAIANRSMSTIYRVRGQFEEAERLCREAISILKREEQPDHRWIAAANLSLADIYLDKRSRDARKLLEECLEVFRTFGDGHWLALTRRSLAEALRGDDEYDAALEQLKLCQESLRQTQDRHWEGQVLHSMGLVYLDRGNTGDTAEAMANFEKALQQFEDDPLWQGRAYVSIGRTAAEAGQTSEARVAYHTAWPLLVEQGAVADLNWLQELLDSLSEDPEATAGYRADPQPRARSGRGA
jgi:tetratricopeptide (TPR) repeat protein